MRSARRIVLAVALLAGGCAPWATYPPDEGALDLSGPRTEPVPTLMVTSIQFLHSRHSLGDEFAVNLPPGTPPQVYEWVLSRVGGGHPMEDPDEPAYHVAKIRVRGLKAQVDVFYPVDPVDGGGYRFATISFHGDIVKGYTHEGTRVWHTGDQPPAPSYVRAAGPQGQGPLARDPDG